MCGQGCGCAVFFPFLFRQIAETDAMRSECYLVTGPVGSQVYIVNEISDIEVVGITQQGVNLNCAFESVLFVTHRCAELTLHTDSGHWSR